MEKLNTKISGLTVRQAEILLATVIIARSTSFMFTKTALKTVSVFNLLAVRFLLAFVILAILFKKTLAKAGKDAVMGGVVIGIGFFIVMALETNALLAAPTGEVCFIENTAVVIVPIIAAVLTRKLPTLGTAIGAKLALVGVGLLTLQGGFGNMTRGHMLACISALTYAAVIVITDRFSKKADALAVGIVQIGTMGVLSLIACVMVETPKLPDTAAAWGSILTLVLICTVFGFAFQTVAQSKASVEKAGLYCALAPVSAAILGVIFLHEQMSVTGMIGAAMILACIIVPDIIDRKMAARRTHKDHMAGGKRLQTEL